MNSSLVHILDSTRSDTVISGWNGACEYSANAVDNNLLCLFTSLVRNLEFDRLKCLMQNCVTDKIESGVNLMILCWQTRATRGKGKGERKLFYDMLRVIHSLFGIEPILATIHLVPHYGYYKDYLYILELDLHNDLNKKIITLYTDQLRLDEADMKKGKCISLAAKFAPTEKTHFSTFARQFATKLFPGDDACYKRYRCLKTTLNEYLKTTETLMSSNKFSEIEFGRVASLCLNRHRKAFLNLQKDGRSIRFASSIDRQMCRANLLAQKNINGKQVQPHEIVAQFMIGHDMGDEKELLEKQWGEVLKHAQEINGTINKALAMVDVSASMEGKPMQVAIALGILVSQISNSAYRNRIFTFETNPHWVCFQEDDSLQIRVRKIMNAGWGGSTNLLSAFDEMLNFAKTYKLSASQFPEVFFIFSDMQFDVATETRWSTHYELIKEKFEKTGLEICGEAYKIPRIIFWNLQGNTEGYPATAFTPNVQMLSGFNPSLMKYVTTSNFTDALHTLPENKTPEETLKHIIEDESFLLVVEALSCIDSGFFKEFSVDSDDDIADLILEENIPTTEHSAQSTPVSLNDIDDDIEHSAHNDVSCAYDFVIVDENGGEI